MTDREKQLIEAYIPSPRDPELEMFEYYAKDTADRIHKVRITNIYDFQDKSYFAVCEVNSGKRVVCEYGDPYFKGFRMQYLYDNKDDCRNNTHFGYDEWEKLREIQMEEENQPK